MHFFLLCLHLALVLRPRFDTLAGAQYTLVSLPNGEGANYSYSLQPVIFRILPDKGPAAGGSLVLLTGMNLSPARDDRFLTFLTSLFFERFLPPLAYS